MAVPLNWLPAGWSFRDAGRLPRRRMFYTRTCGGAFEPQLRSKLPRNWRGAYVGAAGQGDRARGRARGGGGGGGPGPARGLRGSVHPGGGVRAMTRKPSPRAAGSGARTGAARPHSGAGDVVHPAPRSERVRVPAPLIRRRLGSGRGATGQPNATGDGEGALTPVFWGDGGADRHRGRVAR